MPAFIVIARTPSNPVYIDGFVAADLPTAQTMVQAALAKGVGVNAGVKDQIQVAIIQADVAFVVNPT